MSASISAPEANEAMASAILEKAHATGPGLTPGQERANKLKTALYGDGTPTREITEAIGASKAEKIDGKAMEGRIDKAFDDDADKYLARAFDAFSRKLIDEGYDALDAVEKIGASGKVLEGLISSDEALSSILNGRTPAEKNAIAEEILRNPDFISHAKAVYEDLARGVDTDATTPTEDARLRDEEEKAFRVERDARKAEDKMNKIHRQIQDSYKLADRYTNTATGIDPSTGLEYGDKRIALEAAANAVDAISTDPKYVDQQEQEVREYTAEIDDLVAALKVKGVTDVATKNGRLDDLRRFRREANERIAVYNKAVKDRNDLIAERDGLPDKIKELEDQRDTASDEAVEKVKAYHAADAEFQKLQLEIAEAQRTRAESRTEALDNLENVLFNATKAWVKKRSKAAKEANDNLDEEEARKTNDAFEKAVLDQMNTRYKNKEGKFKKRSKAAEGDFDMLTDETLGPKSVLAEYLMRAGYEVEDPPASGNMVLSPEGAEKMKDKDFVKKMTDKLTVRIIRERMANGKLSEADFHLISENPEIKAALTKALGEREHDSHEIAELKAQGVIPKNWKDHINTVTGKKSLMLLLLALFGGVPGFLVGRVVLKDAWGASAH